MYTVDYFIKKFEAIPEENWTTDTQQDELGRRCALGHCRPVSMSRWTMAFDRANNEQLALQSIFPAHRDNDYRNGIAGINNGDSANYQQPTPKQRVLAALYDKKKEELLRNPPIEELISNTLQKSEEQTKSPIYDHI